MHDPHPTTPKREQIVSDAARRSLPKGQVSRLPPLPDPPTDPILIALQEDTRSRGGEVINLHLTMGHAPKIAKARRSLSGALRREAATPRILRELAIVRTAQIVRSDYELNQHLPMALKVGLTQQQLDELPTWRDSSAFDERQRALLAFVEQLLDGGDVDDPTYAAFARHFSPQEIIEISVTATNYYATGLLTRALRIQIEDDGRQTASGL
jgi:alkylhydroperoxidase family enzyme